MRMFSSECLLHDIMVLKEIWWCIDLLHSQLMIETKGLVRLQAILKGLVRLAHDLITDYHIFL